jgi:hypothetical protein
MLQQIGVPDDFLDLYKMEVSATRSFRGNLRIMQHSGNRFTFLMNTLRNVALTNATYHKVAHLPQAYGGDDSLIGGQPEYRTSFNPSQWLMSPKAFQTAQGHLFGHLINNGVLSYDYDYMYNRLMVAILERPLDVDFYRSFADQMVLLPDVESPHYAAVYDALFSHLQKHRLPLDLPPDVHQFTFTANAMSIFSADLVRTEFSPKDHFLTSKIANFRFSE